jgi:hypothetical protein
MPGSAHTTGAPSPNVSAGAPPSEHTIVWSLRTRRTPANASSCAPFRADCEATHADCARSDCTGSWVSRERPFPRATSLNDAVARPVCGSGAGAPSSVSCTSRSSWPSPSRSAASASIASRSPGKSSATLSSSFGAPVPAGESAARYRTGFFSSGGVLHADATSSHAVDGPTWDSALACAQSGPAGSQSGRRSSVVGPITFPSASVR